MLTCLAISHRVNPPKFSERLGLRLATAALERLKQEDP